MILHDAAALGATYNIFSVNNTVYPTAPAFISYTPARYLRPFDLFGHFRPGPVPVKA